jgi:hypothetical protein
LLLSVAASDSATVVCGTTEGVVVAMGCCPDALGVVDDAAAVVDVSVCKADKLTAHVAAAGRFDSRDCAVSLTAVALREASGLSSWLQQMLI